MSQDTDENKAPETPNTTICGIPTSRLNTAEKYARLVERQAKTEAKIQGLIDEVQQAVQTIGPDRTMPAEPTEILAEPEVIAPASMPQVQHRPPEVRVEAPLPASPPVDPRQAAAQQANTAFMGGAMGMRSIPLANFPPRRR